MSLEKTHYDVAILSTGLTQSILSAALSKANLSVIHLDNNDYYADQWASLTLSEIDSWARSRYSKTGISHLDISYPSSSSPSPSTPPAPSSDIDEDHSPSSHQQHESPDGPPEEALKLDRHYALSLAPTLLASTGPSIDTLVKSNVASYATFRLLEHTAVFTSPETIERVPSSKEDIFKHKGLGLIDKRKLMRLLAYAASGDWEKPENRGQLEAIPFPRYLSEQHKLPPHLVRAVAYGVSLSSSSEESTLTALARARDHLRSTGRYGNSAYLVGQYGGAGELAQGYCRASAVHGGTFILAHKVKSLQRQGQEEGGEGEVAESVWSIEVQGLEERITANWVVASDEMLDELDDSPQTSRQEPPASDVGGIDVVRGILVLDRPIDFVETATEPESSYRVEAEDEEDGAKAPVKPKTPPETGLLVFPPNSLEEEGVDGGGGHSETIMALMMGEGTFSCPKGQYVFYLQTQIPSQSPRSAKEILSGAIQAILKLAGKSSPADPVPERDGEEENPTSKEEEVIPILQLVYRQKIASDGHTRKDERLFSVPFPPMSTSGPTSKTTPPTLADLPDLSTNQAERLFWQIVGEEQRSISERNASRRKKRRDPSEFQGRGGRGYDDGVQSEEETEEEEGVDFFG